MSGIKPRNFKGTRDFTPREMIPREKLIDTIKGTFRLYGFNPMETPALEMLEVLSGKYGEEGDKLLYKLDYKNDRPRDRVALRYDLTVPLARVVASHPEWPMPFKRYQVQPVWRADQPQIRQGRFREFYQCDVDTIGSKEGFADAEIIALTIEMIHTLGFKDGDQKAVVHINHRSLLESLCEFAGRPSGDLVLFCRALDKLDKIGKDGVREELAKIGVTVDGWERLEIVMAMDGDPLEKLQQLSDSLPEIESTNRGIEELRNIFNLLISLGVSADDFVFDPHLARGLDYYTGVVFETVLPGQPHIGSLTGGGRYDQLIGLYSGRDLPAVGTTIGLDRIFAAMEQLGMINTDKLTVTEILLAAYSAEEMEIARNILTFFRQQGISAELFPGTGRMKKPFSYADKLKIPFVGVIGPDEIADPNDLKITLKTLASGDQQTIGLQRAVSFIKNQSIE